MAFTPQFAATILFVKKEDIVKKTGSVVTVVVVLLMLLATRVAAKVIPDPSGPGATKTYIVKIEHHRDVRVGDCLSVKFTLKEDVEGITLYVVNKFGHQYSVDLKSRFKLPTVGSHELCVSLSEFEWQYHNNFVYEPYTYDSADGLKTAGIIFWDSQKEPKPLVSGLKIKLLEQ